MHYEPMYSVSTLDIIWKPYSMNGGKPLLIFFSVKVVCDQLNLLSYLSYIAYKMVSCKSPRFLNRMKKTEQSDKDP